MGTEKPAKAGTRITRGARPALASFAGEDGRKLLEEFLPSSAMCGTRILDATVPNSIPPEMVE